MKHKFIRPAQRRGQTPCKPRMPGLATSLAVREADLRASIRPTVAEVDLGALARNASRIRGVVTISDEILCGICKRVPRIYSQTNRSNA